MTSGNFGPEANPFATTPISVDGEVLELLTSNDETHLLVERPGEDTVEAVAWPESSVSASLAFDEIPNFAHFAVGADGSTLYGVETRFPVGDAVQKVQWLTACADSQ